MVSYVKAVYDAKMDSLDEVLVGLGRIVALYHRSSTKIIGASISETTMRPNLRCSPPAPTACSGRPSSTHYSRYPTLRATLIAVTAAVRC
jgi:hypothetical protein